jgi:hypothetical protein
MIIRFNPPQLAGARNSAALAEIAAYLPATKSRCELRILQPFPHVQAQLVYVAEGEKQHMVELPWNWLDATLTKEEMRSQLMAAMHSSRTSGAHHHSL